MSNIEKKLHTWSEQGLISAEQVDKIAAYEKSIPQRSWALYTVATLGVVIFMIGIISIIAANWDSIGDTQKIVGYFIVQGGLALLAYKTHPRAGLGREVFLTLFALFFFAGIALVGQIFNLESDGYSAFLFWLVLTFFCANLVSGRFVPHLWWMAFIYAVPMWIFKTIFPERYYGSFHIALLVYCGVALFLIFLQNVKIAYIQDQFAKCAKFWGYLIAFGALPVVSHFGWESGERVFVNQLIMVVAALYLMTSVAIVLPLKKNGEGLINLSICFALTLVVLFVILPYMIALDYSELGTAAIFILIWASLGVAAVFANRPRLFDLATSLIGIRILVLYFSVVGSLAATGVGLMISGALILGAVFLWHSKRALISQWLLNLSGKGKA